MDLAVGGCPPLQPALAACLLRVIYSTQVLLGRHPGSQPMPRGRGVVDRGIFLLINVLGVRKIKKAQSRFLSEIPLGGQADPAGAPARPPAPARGTSATTDVTAVPTQSVSWTHFAWGRGRARLPAVLPQGLPCPASSLRVKELWGLPPEGPLPITLLF